MKTTDIIRREKILNGNLLPVIFTICFPLFVYNLFSTFYNFIDTIMVSQISTEGVSSVAAISQIKSLFGSIGSGLAAGGGILVARLFGANEFEKGQKYINTITSMSFVVVLILLICIPFANPILIMCGYPKDLIGIGTGYFVVQLLDLAFIVYTSVFIAIQKAKGDTKSIFFLNIIVMIIKLVLTAFFVFIIRVDNTVYIAIATLISEIVLFLVLLTQINKKESVFKVNLFKITFDKEIVKQILVISLPIFFGKFIFSFGKVSVNAMCGQYGAMVVGALAISNNICGVATTPINSFEEGGSTIISQNLGNNNQKRALKSFKYILIISTITGLISYVLIRFVFQPGLISLFSQTKSTENIITSEEFMSLIKNINDYDTLSIPALAINAAVLGILYGYKKTKLAMIINISRVFLFRIPVLWYLQTFHPEMGAECAGISMGISNILIAIMSIIVLIIFLKNLNRKHIDSNCNDCKVIIDNKSEEYKIELKIIIKK